MYLCVLGQGVEYPRGRSEVKPVGVDRGPPWTQKEGGLHRVAPHRREHSSKCRVRLQGSVPL